MSHPSDGELISLAQGELPPPDAERVSSHARGCAACRSTLSKLSGPGEDEEREDSDEAPGKAIPLATAGRRDGRTLPVLPDGTPATGDADEEAEPLERGAAVGRYDILQHLAS